MLVAAILLLPTFSPLRGVMPRLSAPPASHTAVYMMPGTMLAERRAPVPLTGQTLQAALKIRCDTTGAQYAIYWSEQGGKLKPTGIYAASPTVTPYTQGSLDFELDANGNGPVAMVHRSEQPFFIPDVRVSNLRRKELALKQGISQVAVMPYEAGVLEFGNLITCPQWTEMPQAPILPKSVLRTAFEDLGALYVMYWEADFAKKELRVTGDYENPRDTSLRKALRSDGESFVGISRDMIVDIDSEGPVQQALATGQEVVIGFDDDNAYPMCKTMLRGAKAKEFNLCYADFVPVADENGKVGVLEFGVSTNAELNPVTLEAMLQLQVLSTNAAYGTYWKQDGDTARPVKSFTSPWYQSQLMSEGKQYTFVDISEQTTVKVQGPSPMADALRRRSKVYVPDISASADERANVAAEYSIGSVAYIPVVGGCLEIGVPSGGWLSEREALGQVIPNEELDVVIASGATYIMYWKADPRNNQFAVSAFFELPKNKLNEAAKDGDSFVKSSMRTNPTLDGDGPVATAFRSAAKLEVANTATYPSLSTRRREIALEWGVGKMTLLPLETGVLEFGVVTKDKRETTSGSEYKESSRQYRRSVFMHDEWVDHRSTERFLNSIKTTTESGVLRGREDEILAATAFAGFLVVYNTIAGGYTGLGMVKHDAIIPHLPVLSLPLSFFTLTGSSLGLLLVFRTNAAYARWDDARKQWGSIINQARTLVRQANTFFVDDRYPGYGNFRDYRRRVAAETSAFTRCLRCFLRGKSDEPVLEVELKRLGFTNEEVKEYMASGNKQCFALEKLGETARLYGMKEQDRARFDTTLSVLCDNVGACERIFKSPIPLVYTRHTSRFVGLWLGLLPLAIWGADPTWNHLTTVPATALITFLLLGIEELGLQIEEPFGILPMEAFCDGAIYPALTEAVLTDDKKRKLEKEMKMKIDEPASTLELSPPPEAEAKVPALSGMTTRDSAPQV